MNTTRSLFRPLAACSPELVRPVVWAAALCVAAVGLGGAPLARASQATGHAAEPAGGHAAESEAVQVAEQAAERAVVLASDATSDGLPGPRLAGGGERVVKGAPYCAEAVHENVQWLPDPGGAAPNRIVRQTTTRLCRDGEGRTRQEVERGGRRYVYLRDPVAGEGWMLDPQRKFARRLSGSASSLDALADAASWRDYAEQMREWARATAEAARARAGVGPGAPGAGAMPPAAAPASAVAPPAAPAGPSTAAVPPVPPVPPVPAVISRLERVERGGSREAEVTVLRMDREGPRWEMPAPPPAVQWRATHLAPRGPGATTALPARDFEGVRAHGERTTWTIEAGRVGNERPIQIVREVWTAPELLLTVSSRDFDPRSGEVNYRLKNLKRGEPDTDLMRVPADYARQERGGPRGVGASQPRG